MILYRHFQWLFYFGSTMPTICIVGYKYDVGFTDLIWLFGLGMRLTR